MGTKMGFVSTEAGSVLLTWLGDLKSTISDIVSRVKGARTGHLEIFTPTVEALWLQSPVRFNVARMGPQGVKRQQDIKKPVMSPVEWPQHRNPEDRKENDLRSS